MNNRADQKPTLLRRQIAHAPVSNDLANIEVHVLSGLHAGASIRLADQPQTMIGRDGSCDLMLRDESVESRHMMLMLLDGKVCAVRINGDVEIDEIPLKLSTAVALRKGARIRIGEVLLGIGLPDTNWEKSLAPEHRGKIRRWAINALLWLGKNVRRRKSLMISAYVIAIVCVISALAFPIYQLSNRYKSEDKEGADSARMILQSRLRTMKLPDVRVRINHTSQMVEISGYVALDEDVKRIERVALSMPNRPQLAVFSVERIDRESKEYISHLLPLAEASMKSIDTVNIAYPKPLSSSDKERLEQAMLRDVPGVRHVAFDIPEQSALSEISPAPLSILPVGRFRILVGGDGALYFPGAQISDGVVLRKVGVTSISVETRSATSN